MTELKLEADIGCPAEKVFDLITDFAGQESQHDDGLRPRELR